MKTFLISYDLKNGNPSSDYSELIDAIQNYGDGWAKPLESVWLINSNDYPSDIRNYLKRYIDSNDRLLVMDVTNDSWAARGLPSKVVDWMKGNV